MREKLNLLRYEFKYAFLGMKRHLLLCFSAISAITVSLFLVAGFLIVGLHADHFATNIQGDLSIHVILNQEIVEAEQIASIEQQLQALSNIDTMKFSSKEEELELMIKEKGEAFSIYREDNPLSNAYFVYVKDGTLMEQTASQIESIEGVVSCAYGGSSVTQLVQLLETTRKVGYGVIALLLMLSIYLVYNTIRTTIYSRQQEIIIMRQVGGTNGFIKRPFEVQGIIIGFVGASIPMLLLYFGYPKLYEALDGVLFANAFSLLSADFVLSRIGITIVLIGLIIGWFASFWAVSKYLKVKR